MKNMKKWFALLLAGTLLATALVACDSADSGDNNDDGEKQSEKSEGDLRSPKAFKELLCGDKDMTIVEQGNMVEGDETSSYKMTYTRDGDKVKILYESDDYSSIDYVDFAENKAYSGGGDEWIEVEAYDDDWADLIVSRVVGEENDLFFDDDNYTKENNRYVMTEEGADAVLAELKERAEEDFAETFGEDPAFEAYLEYKNGAHVFVYKFEGDDVDYSLEVTLTVTLGDTTVELPDVSDGEES